MQAMALTIRTKPTTPLKASALPELHVIAGKCLPDDRPHPRQLLKQVHIRHHQDSQNAEGKAGCEDAAQAPHGAGDELRGHKLCFRHRQGVHQIALPAQQVAVEPLHDGHDGDDHGADDDAGVDKGFSTGPRRDRIGVTIVLFHIQREPPKSTDAASKGQIHSAIGPGGGPELIFQQLFQHLNTSRKYASTLMPSVSRISSTERSKNLSRSSGR